MRGRGIFTQPLIEASPHHYRTSRGYSPASPPAKHGARG